MDYLHLPNWTVYVGVVGVALSPKKNILVNTYRCADTKIGLLLLVRRDLGVRTDDSDRNGSGHVLNVNSRRTLKHTGQHTSTQQSFAFCHEVFHDEPCMMPNYTHLAQLATPFYAFSSLPSTSSSSLPLLPFFFFFFVVSFV